MLVQGTSFKAARPDSAEVRMRPKMQTFAALPDASGKPTMGSVPSGANSSRSGMERMIKDAARRRFDILLAWDVSRLGRSLTQLVALFDTLRALDTPDAERALATLVHLIHGAA